MDARRPLRVGPSSRRSKVLLANFLQIRQQIRSKEPIVSLHRMQMDYWNTLLQLTHNLEMVKANDELRTTLGHGASISLRGELHLP